MNRPEKPTLIEEIVRLIPVRYPIAALIWAGIIGTPVYHLMEYLDHGTTSFSLDPVHLFSDLLFLLVPFYAFIAVPYLRKKVTNAESSIVPLLPQGESAYDMFFGRMSENLPVLVLTAILFIIAFPLADPSFHLSILPVELLFSTFINSLAIATLMWEYASISWGLHKLGESQLQLRPFLEDRMRGLGPIGNVSLSSTVVYLLGVFFVVLLFPSSFLTQTAYQLVASYFLLLGIVMFFLPLNSVHKKMQAEKMRNQRELTVRFLSIKTRTSSVGSVDGPLSLERVENTMTHLVALKDIELTKKELAATPTWPFDVQLIVKLITIILSVTAALLSRIIINILKL